MNFCSLIRRSALLSVAALAVSVPAYASWGAFGAAVNKGQTGTCVHTVNGVTRRGSVQILTASYPPLDGSNLPWTYDFVKGKNTTSAHTANVGIFYVDTSIPGPWNFFYDQIGGLAPGGAFTGSHGAAVGALAAAQCRVGNGSL